MFKSLIHLFLPALSLALVSSVLAEPVISEFLASNDTEQADEDGDFPDWVEIFNPDDTPVNLGGWYLTDDAARLDRWEFPNVTLQPGAYLLVFASDKNRIDPAGTLHTNFRLSADGEYLALVKPDRSTVVSEFDPFPAQFEDVSYGLVSSDEILLPRNAPLSYTLNSPANDSQERNWTETDFDDSSWINSVPSGDPARSGIGYDRNNDYLSSIQTLVPDGTTEMWVRYEFDLIDAAEITSLLLRLRIDDGFEAFLNGTRVASANIDGGTSATESLEFLEFDLSTFASELHEGKNVISFRVTNAGTSSSDFLLLPELSTEGDISPSDYAYLESPTPGESNNPSSLNAGPLLANLTKNPIPPKSTESLPIEVAVSPRNFAVDQVLLSYRVNYQAEVDLPMSDDGVAPDLTAGDGIYTAAIPPNIGSSGDMLRWKVLATDLSSKTSELPIQVDNTGNSQSPDYHGTLILEGNETSDAPLFRWFTQNEASSRTRTGARASVFLQGRFYDNIFVRQRGGFTNNRSQKFDFNKGHPAFVNEKLASVGELNLNANGADNSYVRQPLGFTLHQDAGNPGCETLMVEMRLNGGFDRVGVLIEQVDEDYLDRFGYPREGGDLFKMVQRSNLNPAFDDTSTGVEKKVGTPGDLSELQALVNDLKLPTLNERTTKLYDNIDVPEVINYLAIRSLQQQADDVRKNFYVFKDTQGDARWRIFPWDLDYTLGISGGSGAERVEHPFFGVQAFPTADGANQWNRLYQVIFEDPVMRRLYLRRLRTLMDDFMGSGPATSWFEPRVDALFETIDSYPGPSTSGKNSLRNTEIPERRNDLFNQFTVDIEGFSEVIPQPEPSMPDIRIEEVDFSPSSGDQDQEFIRLENFEDTEIDLSGWTISGGVNFTLPAGTVIPRNGSLYLSPDLKAFGQRQISPKALEKRLVTGPYSGKLSSFGETLTLHNAESELVQNFAYEGAPSPAQEHLVISEFIPDGGVHPDAEFIEVLNISDTETVSLVGCRFTRGIDFDFANSAITQLAPGESLLIIYDQIAFNAVYGNAVDARIAGTFENGTRLNNAGEEIKFEDATNSTIHEFRYSSVESWPIVAGRSLNLIAPLTRPDHDLAANWSSSSSPAGSPAGAPPVLAAWLASRGTTATDDPDLDGLTEEITYALGWDLSTQAIPLKLGEVVVSGENGDTTLTSFEWSFREGASSQIQLQRSTNLIQWLPLNLGDDLTEISRVKGSDGKTTLKVRLQSQPTGDQFFYRLLAN